MWFSSKYAYSHGVSCSAGCGIYHSYESNDREPKKFTCKFCLKKAEDRERALKAVEKSKMIRKKIQKIKKGCKCEL